MECQTLDENAGVKERLKSAYVCLREIACDGSRIQTHQNIKMVNPRQEEKSAHNVEDTVRRTNERATEETRRVGLRLRQGKKWLIYASTST
jgi:hypothetical protein